VTYFINHKVSNGELPLEELVMALAELRVGQIAVTLLRAVSALEKYLVLELLQQLV